VKSNTLQPTKLSQRILKTAEERVSTLCKLCGGKSVECITRQTLQHCASKICISLSAK
jgi:hypothetical protein